MCEKGHVAGKWCSQPKLSPRGLYAGDYMQACSIFLSGNNYQKIRLMNNFMDLGTICTSTYDALQAQHVIPVINDHWDNMQHEQFRKLKNKQLILAGKHDQNRCKQ